MMATLNKTNKAYAYSSAIEKLRIGGALDTHRQPHITPKLMREIRCKEYDFAASIGHETNMAEYMGVCTMCTYFDGLILV